MTIGQGLMIAFLVACVVALGVWMVIQKKKDTTEQAAQKKQDGARK